MTVGVKADNGEDLPRNLLVIEFKSLLVDKLPRPRTERQQTGGKNFKKFRKVCPADTPLELPVLKYCQRVHMHKHTLHMCVVGERPRLTGEHTEHSM